MSDGFSILAVANKADDFMHDAAGYLFQICRVGWVCFLLKPAGYLRDRRGIFLNGAGFRRDIGGVFQLLET